MKDKSLKILFLIEINVLMSVVLLCGCSAKQPEYNWEPITQVGVLSIFHEQKETLQAIADSLMYNENDFYHNTTTNGDTKTWLQSPYDKKKMNYFNEEEQQLITDFIEATRPYMIVVWSDVHVSFDYINEDQTGSYSIDYYTGLDHLEAEATAYEQKGQLIERTGGGWLIKMT